MQFISDKIKERFDGHGPSARNIRRYVSEYKLPNASPKKCGTPGHIEKWLLDTICSGMETFIRIQQVNGRAETLSRRKLAIIVNSVAGRDGEGRLSYKLIDRVLRLISIDLTATKVACAEERRIRWTSYRNLKLWFDNWKSTLIDLGFTEEDEDGNIQVRKEKEGDILNLDETCISLDGSQGNRGGRPAVVIWDPSLPAPQLAQSKSALTSTLIGGSTAANEALPAHLQLMTKAQSAETERVRNKMATWLLDVRGKFGHDEEKNFPITIGMNEKGGMDEAEFAKYILNSITPLFPNAKAVFGKWVIIKVDSGPGRMSKDLLAKLRFLGFILFLGVPNTTAVSQETDRLYGVFKLTSASTLRYLSRRNSQQGF